MEIAQFRFDSRIYIGGDHLTNYQFLIILCLFSDLVLLNAICGQGQGK